MMKFTVHDREVVTNFINGLSGADKTLTGAISSLIEAHDVLKEELRKLTKTSPDYENGFNDGLNERPCRPKSLEYVSGYEYGKRVAIIGLSEKH